MSTSITIGFISDLYRAHSPYVPFAVIMSPQRPLGYVCDPSYKCKCTNCKLLSWRTAKRHRDVAQKREDLSGNRSFLPLPTRIESADQIPGYCSSPQHSPDDQSASDESEYSSPSETLSEQFVSETNLQITPPSSTEMLSNSESNFVNTDCDDTCAEIIDPKFYTFWKKHCNLLGLAIRHCASGAFVDDLIREATKR